MEFNIIKVGKECKINTKDFAPCMKDYRKTLISVTQSVEDETGFINFMVAYDYFQQCCENFEVQSSIECCENSDIYVECIKYRTRNYNVEFFEFEAEIIGRDGKVLATCKVINEHNGYYSHLVEATINNDIKVFDI